MRKIVISAVVMVLVVSIASLSLTWAAEQWPGVDDAVVKKFAEQAGRPPSEPFINTAQGDLLLFCFLVAGAVGGFVMGYCVRALFPPKQRPTGD